MSKSQMLALAIYAAAGARSPCCPLTLATRILGPDGVMLVPPRALGGAPGALARFEGRRLILLADDRTRREQIATCAHELGEWALVGEALAPAEREAQASRIGAALLLASKSANRNADMSELMICG